MGGVALLLLAGALAGLWVRPPDYLPAALFIVIPAGGALWWVAGPRAIAGVAGFVWSSLHATWYMQDIPGIWLRGADVTVSGCVVTLPAARTDRTIVGFRVAGAAPPGWQGKQLQLAVYPPVAAPAAGDCLSVQARLKRPHGTANPGQFDRERDLLARDIAATGYVRTVVPAAAPAHLPAWHPVRWRAGFLARLQAALGDHPAAGLLAGLTVGHRADVSAEQWETLRGTGTTHLMAISGLHVGLVAAVVWFLAGALPAAVQAVMRPTLVALAAMGYAMLAGWTVPTARAAGMVLLALGCRIGCRHTAGLRVLWVVLATNLLLDPFTVLRPGFWMSYLAAGLLLTGSRTGGRMRQACAAQLRLALGLLAPALLLFDQYPLLAIATNLVAIPVFGVMILPLVLLSCAVLFVVPAYGALAVTAVADLLLASVSLLAHTVTVMDVLPVVRNNGTTAGVAVLVLLAGLWRRRPLLALAPAAVVCVWLVSRQPAVEVAASIDVIDVGQGTAVLVRTREHALLVDAGPSWRSGDAGERNVLPLLRARRITSLDGALLSHADDDHSGGLDSVLAAVPAGFVMTSDGGPADAWRCRRGMEWQWDGVDFTVLHPASAAGWSDNNASCVLRIAYRNAVVLLPGDIEAAAERVLVAREGSGLAATVIVVPHHGSTTSSSAALVAATQPDYAVFTTGFWNRWGFPSAAVSARWQSVGACSLDTALTGAIGFAVDTDGKLELQTLYKAGWWRPWPLRWRPADECARVESTIKNTGRGL